MPHITRAKDRSVEAERARSHGFIYGVLWEPDGPGHELAWEDLDGALLHPNALVWLHFNAANAHAREWLARCARLPEPLRRYLIERDDRKRLELVGDGVMGVISDVHYRFDFDPDQIALLRFYLDDRYLISTRHQPLSAPDELRRAIRNGLRIESTGTLMVSLFELQAHMLGEIAGRLNREIGEIEDQVLAHRLRNQRGKLGSIRRLAVRLHRHFAPEQRALQRLCARHPVWFHDSDLRGLQLSTEELGEVVNDLDEIQERAKLLQEELAGHAAEEASHNLIVLSIVTTVFLPMTLITGIFGMNVLGLPGVEDESAFWWVILGMAGVALVALLLLYWKRLF